MTARLPPQVARVGDLHSRPPQRRQQLPFGTLAGTPPGRCRRRGGTRGRTRAQPARRSGRPVRSASSETSAPLRSCSSVGIARERIELLGLLDVPERPARSPSAATARARPAGRRPRSSSSETCTCSTRGPVPPAPAVGVHDRSRGCRAAARRSRGRPPIPRPRRRSRRSRRPRAAAAAPRAGSRPARRWTRIVPSARHLSPASRSRMTSTDALEPRVALRAWAASRRR